jgi:hypothetical protein
VTQLDDVSLKMGQLMAHQQAMTEKIESLRVVLEHMQDQIDALTALKNKAWGIGLILVVLGSGVGAGFKSILAALDP